MDAALLQKSKRQQTEMKRGGGGLSSSTTTYFPLVRDIIYTNPLKVTSRTFGASSISAANTEFRFFISLILSQSLLVCLSL